MAACNSRKTTIDSPLYCNFALCIAFVSVRMCVVFVFFTQVDIIHRYNADEARNLKQYGELPEHARINETAVDLAMEGDGAEDDIGIDFDGI